MGVAFFFLFLLLALSEDADGDWSARRNLHLLPNVQVPFCHCQQTLFLGPADDDLPLLFLPDESLLLLLPFFPFILAS